MTEVNISKYDDALLSILVNEKSIFGFLSTIFNFLSRRTDFYYVPKGPYENMGFPEGVAEELVLKVVKACDPKNWRIPNVAPQTTDITDEIMCSTVAQEVEIESEEVIESENTEEIIAEDLSTLTVCETPSTSENNKNTNEYVPPEIPVQHNSESYNGAVRENYIWSQTIMELDVSIKLPPDIKSSKDLKVTINANDISVLKKNGDIIVKDSLPHKIKPLDSFWSISEGKLLIHLEKALERWWNKFLNEEDEIDISKIDCSRPMDELPDDHIAKIRELQWNQEQKMKGLPTSDEIRNIEVLKKAWNLEGSPFKGKEFDPSVLYP